MPSTPLYVRVIAILACISILQYTRIVFWRIPTCVECTIQC
nr:MAG TPA: hypothetical protein [Caudoviricetes sp.]